jgi:hypothetical protein
MMKKHVVQMAAAGGVILTGLWAFGVPLSTALPYALLLACPLMMIWMMTGMNHDGMNHGMGPGSSDDRDEPKRTEHPPSSSWGDR